MGTISEEDWQINLDNLIGWAKERHYTVDIHEKGVNAICHISKLIEINSKNSIKKQVYLLLHECGHLLIFENGGSYDYLEIRKEKETSIKYKVFRVIEEAEAWKKGEKLAKRLKISLDDDWEKEMIKALNKYIKWAA